MLSSFSILSVVRGSSEGGEKEETWLMNASSRRPGTEIETEGETQGKSGSRERTVG